MILLYLYRFCINSITSLLMRKVIFIALLNCIYVTAQNNAFQEKSETLKSKIASSEKTEKLMWLDSLTTLVQFDEALKYDSIARETITYALKLDSLNIATTNTSKLIHYHSNIMGDSEEGLRIFKDFLSTIESVKSNAIKGRFYLYGGDSYAGQVDFDMAFKYYNLAKDWALKANNQLLLGTIALKTGGVLMEMGEAVDASKHIQEAIRIFAVEKDTLNLINAKNDISILYSQNAFYKEAEKERNEAIALSNTFKEDTAVSLLYYNAAADYRLIDDQEKRISNLRLALKHNNSEFRRFYEPFFLCDLTIALAENDSIEKAEQYFDKIKSDPDIYSEGIQKEMYIEVLKQIALGKNQFKEAIDYGKQHLELKKVHKGYVEIMNAEKFLSDVYKKTNDNRNSEKHLINYYKIKDSISKVQNVKSLTYYQTLYETEKRDLKIQAQESDIALLDEKNKVKNQWLLFGGLGLLAVFGIILLWRSRNAARKREQLQEQFSQDLLTAQEEERTRVSKDLHDSVGQQLTLIKKKAQNLEQEELSAMTNNALEEVRSISRGLFPATLKQLGVTESIQQLLNDLDEETDMFFSVEIDDIDNEFNETETLNLYRFIQETVTNALKHAKAKTLIVNITKHKNSVDVLIKDNGVGFDNVASVKQHSLGLKTITERIRMLKGTLSIKSKKEEGTLVLAQIPIV